MTKKRVAFFTLGCKLNFAETSTIARHKFMRNNCDPSAIGEPYITGLSCI